MIPPGKIFAERQATKTEFVGINDKITTEVTVVLIMPDAQPHMLHVYDKVTGEKINECSVRDMIREFGINSLDELR